jgi:hypothetical protein
MARVGAAGQFSRAQAPAVKTFSARRPVHSRSKHATAAARPDATRRGWVPCTPNSNALSRAPAKDGRRGPTLALGCAVSATASSLPHRTTQRHGQSTGLEARRALGAEHDGAARGSPRSLQQNSPKTSLNEFARSTRLGVATAPGSRRQGATWRRSWGNSGATRSTSGGSKARP